MFGAIFYVYKKERAKEVAELDSQKQEISSVVAQLGEEVSVKKRELRKLHHNRRRKYCLQVIRI